MTLFFITPMISLSIKEKLGRGDRLDDSTFITNEISAIQEYLTTDFVHQIGVIEANFIKNSPAVVYSIKEDSSDIDPQEHIHSQLAKIFSLLNMMWLIKDNSVNVDRAYSSSEQGQGRIRFDSSSRIVRYTLSDGQDKVSEFSRSELKEARRLLRERLDSPSFLDNEIAAAVGKRGRLELGMYFLGAARGKGDLGLKVANYCSVLEALFGTGRTELTHRLAERVSAFLYDDYERRLETYSNVKKAYEVRSTVIHGAAMKVSKSDHFLNASTALDELVRQILSLVFIQPKFQSVFELNEQDFDEVCLRRVFGQDWESIFSPGDI